MWRKQDNTENQTTLTTDHIPFRRYHSIHCPTDAQPALPNYIQPMKIDPKLILGKWYGYLYWNSYWTSSDLPVANYIAEFRRLTEKIPDAAGDENGLMVERLSSIVEISHQDNDSTSCFPTASLLQIAISGQVKDTFFVDYATNESDIFLGMASAFVLSTDYHSYMVYYECHAHNITSGLCRRPYVSVLTRKRPDAVSPATARLIAASVDRMLGRYCFGASNLLTIPWINRWRKECRMQRPKDSCYRKLFKNLVSPSWRPASELTVSKDQY
ncbi:uncharacterized protein LOC129591134 isoform X2 [Paramacrobiotus metropolitanus]|nr:uncharacterized protein LOC129591134 isoform X2 [Paramacrobiotus metropolitanus]